MNNLSHRFYENGLRFSCTRCSACCRFEQGYVFLSQDDLSLLCAELKMKPFEFEKVYCRRIDLGYGEKKLSLKETSVFDCIFWKDGCTVYNARPFMCRSYPFWDSMLASKTAWENASAYCPGCNKEDGMLYSKTSIEEWLRQEEEHKCIKN